MMNLFLLLAELAERRGEHDKAELFRKSAEGSAMIADQDRKLISAVFDERERKAYKL